MNEKAKQPYKDIREHLKDSNFNNVVMEAFELMCGETVEMDLQFDNYPMAHTKYRETEASKKSIEFSEKYHGTSVVVKLALEQREELLKELKDLREFAKVLCKMKIVDSNHKIYGIDKNDIALIKKVVEKYGNQIEY